jgi:hypothetical protein
MGEALGPPSAGGNPTRRAGLNRFVWDLRYPGAFTFPGMILRSARPEDGPLAPPGAYQVRVTALGETKVQKFSIVRHPRLTEFNDADLKAQFDLAVQIRDKVSAANRAVVQVRDVRSQVEARATQAADPRITSDAQKLAASLSAGEEALYLVRNRSPRDALNYPVKLNNKLAALQRSLETGDMRPTAGATQVFQELSAELDAELRKLDTLLQVDVPALNRKLEARKVPLVAVPPRAPVA